MSRKTISMRGEVVDFDLFAIKDQISSAPVTETIETRERFISLKRKRGTKRKIQDLLAEQELNKNAVAEATANKHEEVEEPNKKKIIKKES